MKIFEKCSFSCSREVTVHETDIPTFLTYSSLDTFFHRHIDMYIPFGVGYPVVHLILSVLHSWNGEYYRVLMMSQRTKNTNMANKSR